LCDGSNGTPDLRDRFIVGAGRKYSPNNQGGADAIKLTANQSGLRAHTVSGYTNIDGKHRHEYLDTYMDENKPTSKGDYEDGDGVDYKKHRRTTYDTKLSNHRHKISVSVGADGAIDYHENRPPYYALAYIMKD
jgi:microcystin-dependent protein